MSFEYLFILLFLFLIAFCFQKYHKIKLFNNRKHILTFSFIVVLIGIIWDNFAVYRGHWFYPGKGILGIFLGLIPLEDYFFILVCAYFVLVVYKVTEKLK